MEVSSPPPASSGFRAANAAYPLEDSKPSHSLPPQLPLHSHAHSQHTPPASTAQMQYGPVQSNSAQEPVRDAPTPATPAPRDSTRTRHSSACFPCAKRKVKCDRDIKNPCSNCLRRSQPDQCQVKSHKEKLSHARAADPALRESEAHRDKRPRYEAYQSSFHATPAVKSELSPASNGSDPTLMSSMANYAANPPDERAQPLAKRSPPPPSSKRSRESSHWESIEALLPPRKDFIKYINTFRIGPHVVNPVIHDLDAFESQVCTFLEEIGTPKLRSRLTGKDRRVAEVELGRLARLLAVLAAGSRYEDSDCATQVAISREYVRRAFQCLRLANFMTRPTIECIQTLILLVSELHNDHEPDASWAMLASTARLAHSLGINFSVKSSRLSDPDYAIARSAIAWQDMMHALWRQDPGASIAHGYPALASANSEESTPSLLATLCDVHRSALAAHELTTDSTDLSTLPSPELMKHVDFMHGTCHSYLRRDCKNMRDRIEVAAFKLHGFYLLATILLRIGELKGRHYPTEAAKFDHQAREALVEVIQTFVEFSTISTLPVRTHCTVHYALISALELCRWNHAPDGQFQGQLLPKLLSSLDSLTGQVANGNGASHGPADALLPAVQLKVHHLLERIYVDSRQVYADRTQEREIPESMRVEASHLLEEMHRLQDVTDNPDASMPMQAIWGL